MPLQDVLTLQTVRELAGEKTFARGKAYFHDGAVGLLHLRSDVLHADVDGTYRYHVTLSESPDGGLDHDCDCPVGQDGDFCKHAVAVALSWLENEGEEAFPPEEAKPAKARRKRKTQGEILTEFFARQDAATLSNWLLEAAGRDKGLRDRLLLAARSAEGGNKNLRNAVLQAARLRGFLAWDETWQYAERLHDAAALIEKHIPEADEALIELIEGTIALAESSLENADDSSGAIQEAIRRLGQAHLAACLQAKPDPVVLANRLWKIETRAQWDFYPPALPDYLPALGKKGLAVYRDLALGCAESLPVIVEKAGGYEWDPVRRHTEATLEKLAEKDGDYSACLRLLEKDLSSPRRYLKLAELHMGLGDAALALAWAEKGLAAFPDARDDSLSEFCIAACRKTGKHDRADELAWVQFARRADFGAYRQLLKHARNTAQRDTFRSRAIAHLEAMMQKEEAPGAQARHAWRRASSRSELVRIYLHEKLPEQVWTVFSGGAVYTDLWPEVADMRGKTHPEDAIRLYKQLLPGAVKMGAAKARYEEAFEFVKAIRTLRMAQGQKSLFADELAALRAEYKAKRNLVKLLDTLS